MVGTKVARRYATWAANCLFFFFTLSPPRWHVVASSFSIAFRAVKPA